jgi:hypothetical protein
MELVIWQFLTNNYSKLTSQNNSTSKKKRHKNITRCNLKIVNARTV